MIIKQFLLHWVLTDPTLNGKIDEYNKAQLYRKSLLESHIPSNNPAIREQDEIIERLRTDILEAMKNIKASTALFLLIVTNKEKAGTGPGKISTSANKKIK